MAVLGRAFGLELSVMQDTTVFEVASEDGDTKVQVLVQDVSERKFVLMSAAFSAPPPDCGEKLLRRRLLTIRLHGFGTMRVMKQFGIIRNQH